MCHGAISTEVREPHFVLLARDVSIDREADFFGVWLVAALYDPNVHFVKLLFVLAAASFVTATLALALPQDSKTLVAEAAK